MDTNYIGTKRLILRTMRRDDLDALHLVFSDPRVLDAFGLEEFTREQMEGWLQRNLEHQARYGYGLFSVIDRASGKLIGDCGLENMKVDGQAVTELGYDFRSDYWDRGIATEAAAAVRDYAFGTLGLSRLVSLIRVGNVSSRRVAEKIGMRIAGEITRSGTPYWEFAIEAAKGTGR